MLNPWTNDFRLRDDGRLFHSLYTKKEAFSRNDKTRTKKKEVAWRNFGKLLFRYLKTVL